MLELLRISNYAIIDDLEIDFRDGLVAITGETGAGKSIIMGALKLALGERASAEVIRTGAQRASIEAVFSIPPGIAVRFRVDEFLSEIAESGEAIFRREVLLSGGSRAFINNRSAPIAQLKELGELLLDIHGQNEQMSLLSTELQLRMLDAYAAHAALLDAYKSAYRDLRSSTARLEELCTTVGDAERRKSFLEFQVQEITTAAPVPGELEQLESERRRLQNSEKLQRSCQAACDLLYDGEGDQPAAAALIGSVSRALADIVACDPAQQQFVDDAASLRYAAEDLASRIRSYAQSISAEPARLAAVEDRIDLLRKLRRKYGSTEQEILAACEQMQAELASIEHRDEEIAQLEREHVSARAAAVETGGKLSKSRARAARQFGKIIQEEIRGLELPHAAFSVALDRRTPAQDEGVQQFGPEGMDTVEFMITLNPGEEQRPLRKVASGGEISRIMLGLECVLAKKLEVQTLVFDEIDIGISGEAAAKVGAKLRELSQSRQVLCITHLPQVAAQGDAHIVVEKAVDGERTVVTARAVSGEERTSVIAQMLAGRSIDQEARKYARKLLSRTH